MTITAKHHLVAHPRVRHEDTESQDYIQGCGSAPQHCVQLWQGYVKISGWNELFRVVILSAMAKPKDQYVTMKWGYFNEWSMPECQHDNASSKVCNKSSGVSVHYLCLPQIVGSFSNGLHTVVYEQKD